MSDKVFKVSKKVSFEELGGDGEDIIYDENARMILQAWLDEVRKENPGIDFGEKVAFFRDEEGITFVVTGTAPEKNEQGERNMSLSEDDVRRIIREEFKSLLVSLARTAEKLDGYDTQKLESAGLHAVKSVMNQEVRNMPHAENCIIHASYLAECSCHVRLIEKG